MTNSITTVPCGSSPSGQTILTVSDGNAHGQIRFQHDVPTESPRVVIEPPEWIDHKGESSNLIVRGSDLAALRDQLNALPEEAFDDPMPTPLPWRDGDVILYKGGDSIYTRVGGKWQRLRTVAPGPYVGERLYHDVEMDELISGKNGAYVAIRRGGVKC